VAFGSRGPVRTAKRWVQVRGFQRWTENLFGQGLSLPPDEVSGRRCALALPAIAGSRSPGGAEDVSHSVHEEWAEGVLAST